MSNKENLIAYLIRNGKDLSWHELAKGFGYTTADAARGAWNNYRKENPGTPTYINQPAMTHATPFVALKSKTIQAKEQYAMDLEDKITKYEEDLTKGTAQVEASVGQEIKTLDELVSKCNIDLSKWQITKWVQNFWNNRYQVKVWLAPKEVKEVFQQNFIEFLSTYKPEITPIWKAPIGYTSTLPFGCLIINKQDAHLDKYDIHGDNIMKSRFENYLYSVNRVVNKAKLSYDLNKIVYIIGSDEFNSEWTGMTTKGTPQKNLIDYHSGFSHICNHEITVISSMLAQSNAVEVLYMPGNHDEYVGWHLIRWLAAYYKDEPRVKFDTTPDYRKYLKFGNSAIMFNHGDVIKPQKLASIFPQEFREEWSSCEYQYIFTGDKHHEVSLDLDGILFLQLTQSSNSTSSWDSKQGFQARGFLSAFVISEEWGLADRYTEKL